MNIKLTQSIQSNISSLMQSRTAMLLFSLILMLIVKTSFAEDVLSGAEGVVKEAYNGSVKTYLYIGEAVAAIVTVIFTRNIKTLGNIGAVIIFVNVVAAIAGV